MERWIVSELARLSGVSARTLHHYDAVGLLKPAFVGRNGYRYYGREELLRLQQILFHRGFAPESRRNTEGRLGSRHGPAAGRGGGDRGGHGESPD